MLNGLLLTALVGGSLFVYPELPDRIPLHFGADGAPDRWGDRSLLNWMLLPLIALGTTVLLYGIGYLAPRRPGIINVPDKDRLLALPPESRRWVIEGISLTLYVTNAVTLLMFALIQYGAWRTAMEGSGRGTMMTALILGLVVLPLVALSSVLVGQKRIDAAWRRRRADPEQAG